MKKTYIKGIDINTIKIGDKIWFKEDGRGMEIGVVSKVEGTKVWANWKWKKMKISSKLSSILI